jgi:hypothetical protein
MSAVFAHQPLALPQKIDSRGGLFGCKMGLVVNADKMNFYSRKPPFAPILGLFAAKYTAIWCKTQYVLVLNAVRFGAKRKVKCC